MEVGESRLGTLSGQSRVWSCTSLAANMFDRFPPTRVRLEPILDILHLDALNYCSTGSYVTVNGESADSEPFE
jgi:hypothetical protein